MPPAARRADRHTPESLLAVAVEVFNVRGYDGTSMEELAKAAGITKSSIYHHVAGKEELLRLAVTRALDGLFAALEEPGAVQGAPVDVFASADQTAMDRAQAQGVLSAGSRVDFAANQLVLIVPSSSHVRVDTLKDLLGPAFKRIAWGNPASVPAGRYARRVLEQAGLADALESQAVLAQNVRQCLDYVSRDEVDAGFVYATDAAMARDRVRIALRLDSPTPITYPMAIVAQAAHAPAAQSFRHFVLSADGQALLAKYGFLKPH